MEPNQRTTQATTPPTIPQPLPSTNQSKHTPITVLLLLFLNPIGLIYMWWKAKWALWVKILVTTLSLIFVIIPAVLAIAVILTVNPAKVIQEAKDAQSKSRAVQERTQKQIQEISQPSPP